MFFGYNTNGLAHHDLFDAVALLAEIGYRGIAVTIDHGALSPRDPNAPKQLARLRESLKQYGMRSVIETGARFLLDPRAKHEPTLLSPERRRRIEFYRYAIDRAAELKSDCVSIWSGALREPLSRDAAMDRLVEGLRETLDYAAARNVAIGFEPEPGMFIDTMRAFDELSVRLGRDDLRLTLDIGHLECQGETPIAEVIRRWADRLVNVHIEDMRAGRHEHLMFGEGEIDFPPVLRALAESGYAGGVFVELSRHSHAANHTTQQAWSFLVDIVVTGKLA